MDVAPVCRRRVAANLGTVMSTPVDLVIIGAGGHGRSLADVVEATNDYRIIGFLDDFRKTGESVSSYPVIGRFEHISALVSPEVSFAIGIGQIKSPQQRRDLHDAVVRAGGILPVISSPDSYVSPQARIGDGTAIFHGAVVNAGALIGANCIINSQALVEHDAIVGDHCHISTGALVNGGATIGEGSFIGSGAIVLQDQMVPPNSVVPAGTRFEPRPSL